MSTIKVDSIVSSDGNTDLLTLSNGAVSGVNLGRRNLIINGAMQVAQRGTSFTGVSNGTYTLDRWYVSNVGSTGAGSVSRQSFTLGQTDVPNEPKYYLRYSQTSAGGEARDKIYQKIEDVRTGAGQTVTLSFWVKANATITLGTRFAQYFGGGGGGSATVFTTEQTWEATTSWQKITITVTLASISGKTLGSSNNDYLGLALVRDLDGLSTFDVDIAQVQLEVGSVATPFEHRSYGEELALCQRYYWRGNLEGAGYGFVYGTTGSYPYGGGITFPTQMRAQPTCAIVTAPTTVNCSVSNNQLLENVHGFIQQLVPASNGMCRANLGVYEADAEL